MNIIAKIKYNKAKKLTAKRERDALMLGYVETDIVWYDYSRTQQMIENLCTIRALNGGANFLIIEHLEEKIKNQMPKKQVYANVMMVQLLNAKQINR